MDSTDIAEFEYEQQNLESEASEAYLRMRIMAIFRNYPILSPSMVQIGMGAHIKSRVWRPVLESLISEGLLEREFITTPSERGGFRIICRLKLAPTPPPIEEEKTQAVA